MAKGHSNLHICDDWISCEIADLSKIHVLCETLRGSAHWTEVVGGMDSIAVQFDPQLIHPDEAVQQIEQALAQPVQKLKIGKEVIRIPACYHPSLAPDLQTVSDVIGISSDAIADWHCQLEFTVTMLGFMPGFAYLQCATEIPNIGRLSQPRQNVIAGSIGMIGDQTCLYSFNSPGGWPIIGRSPSTLFDPSRSHATLLTAGQKIKFAPVSLSEFGNLL